MVRDLPNRLKIAIDPEVKAEYGPEVCWTWRLLLSGIGFPWEEVSFESQNCDIVYSSKNKYLGNCLLWIRANLRYWQQRSNLHFRTVGQNNGWVFPVYENDNSAGIINNCNGTLICERDIIFDVFWIVTGQQESNFPKNKHGHFDLRDTKELQEKVLQQALASNIGMGLEKLLTQLGFSEPLPRWPSGKKAAVCVGHDVDYPEVIKWLEPFRVMLRQGLKGAGAAFSVLSGQRNHWHFQSWVETEKNFDACSAFYFVARKGSLLEFALGTPDPFYDVRSKRFRELFQFLTDEGFEIGLHASYLAYTSKEKLANEKQLLEEASGLTVVGNRHHYWHMDPDDLESTLLLHEQVGMNYDTSLIHEKYIGWRRGLCWPFFPFHQKKRRQIKTLQMPTAWMDDQLFGYKQHNQGEPRELLQELIEKTAEHGGCLVVDVHDYVYDEALFPSWAEIYIWFLEQVTARTDFWMDTPRNIADHWIQRNDKIAQASSGLTGEVEHA